MSLSVDKLHILRYHSPLLYFFSVVSFFCYSFASAPLFCYFVDHCINFMYFLLSYLSVFSLSIILSFTFTFFSFLKIFNPCVRASPVPGANVLSEPIVMPDDKPDVPGARPKMSSPCCGKSATDGAQALRLWEGADFCQADCGSDISTAGYPEKPRQKSRYVDACASIRLPQLDDRSHAICAM